MVETEYKAFKLAMESTLPALTTHSCLRFSVAPSPQTSSSACETCGASLTAVNCVAWHMKQNGLSSRHSAFQQSINASEIICKNGGMQLISQTPRLYPDGADLCCAYRMGGLLFGASLACIFPGRSRALNTKWGFPQRFWEKATWSCAFPCVWGKGCLFVFVLPLPPAIHTKNTIESNDWFNSWDEMMVSI